jgi:hypothetical protein
MQLDVETILESVDRFETVFTADSDDDRKKAILRSCIERIGRPLDRLIKTANDLPDMLKDLAKQKGFNMSG